MDGIQNFVGAAQQVIDTMQRVVSKVQETQTQQVASKETQQGASKETRQGISQSQANKYFWNGVMASIITGSLLYSISLPRVTHEEKK